ncbi:MAG: hypothetical protein ACKO96_08615 [Flammeovirgaceae bacterium]
MKSNFLLKALVTIFFFASCGEKEKTNDLGTTIVKETLASAIMEITYDAMDSSLIIHRNIRPDKAKEKSVPIYFSRIEKSIDHEQRFMLSDLVSKISDSVKIVLDTVHFKHNFIMDSTPSDSIIQGSKFYFGELRLSNPSLNKERNLACYYLAFEASYPMSGGYLVFVKRLQKKWVVSKTEQIWFDSKVE